MEKQQKAQGLKIEQGRNGEMGNGMNVKWGQESFNKKSNPDSSPAFSGNCGASKIMECQKEKNLKTCPCTWPDCPRKGMCCECVRHHLQKGELPACYFSKTVEATYDRSIENFIKNRN